MKSVPLNPESIAWEVVSVKPLRLFAAPFVVLVATMSIVTVTATSAAALDVGGLTKAALKSPTVEVGAKGASLFGRFSNPVGWTITAGMVAWWAYGATDGFTDIKIPDWKLDHYREMDPHYTGPIGPVPNAPSTYASDLMEADVSASGREVVVHMRCLKASRYLAQGMTCKDFGARVYASWIWHPAYVSSQADWTANNWADCRNTATGASRFDRPGFAVGSEPAANGVWVTKSVPICLVGEVLQGFYLSAAASTGDQHAPMAWGTLQTAPPALGVVKFGRYNVDVECQNWRTDAVQHITSFTTAADGGAVLPSCAARLGEDWRATGLTITPTMPEIDNKPIPAEIPVPDFLPLDWDELLPADPDWQPCQKTKDGCALDVWIDGKRCFDTIADCKIWTKVQQREPDRVGCKWGTHPVDIKVCLPLKDFYNPDTTTQTPTQTTTPTTGVDTGTTTGTGTTTAVDEALPNPENAEAKSKCLPQGWGKFNPIEWVYRPVKCALTWAFEPTTDMATRMNRMRGKFTGRAPFKWVESMAALPATIPGSGCPDWRIKVKTVDKNIICGTGFGDAMRSARPVWSVLMVGAAFWPLIRSVMYASFPVIKPTPTS